MPKEKIILIFCTYWKKQRVYLNEDKKYLKHKIYQLPFQFCSENTYFWLQRSTKNGTRVLKKRVLLTFHSAGQMDYDGIPMIFWYYTKWSEPRNRKAYRKTKNIWDATIQWKQILCDQKARTSHQDCGIYSHRTWKAVKKYTSDTVVGYIIVEDATRNTLGDVHNW